MNREITDPEGNVSDHSDKSKNSQNRKKKIKDNDSILKVA